MVAVNALDAEHALPNGRQLLRRRCCRHISAHHYIISNKSLCRSDVGAEASICGMRECVDIPAFVHSARMQHNMDMLAARWRCFVRCIRTQAHMPNDLGRRMHADRMSTCAQCERIIVIAGVRVSGKRYANALTLRE